MNQESKRSSFDELVAGINTDERKYLLSKLNQNKNDMAILQPINDITDVSTLSVRFQNEPLLYKFFLWIRSMLTKKPKAELYNGALIARVASHINRDHPGIINTNSDVLQSLFYEKIRELKESADFFKPYFSVVNDNPGRFYVFMSTFIAPEHTEEIGKAADPYQIPFERELTSELRASLIRKMDAMLKNIASATRANIYAAARSVIWLKQFTELPFIHFTSQFTSVISEDRTCPYDSAQTDYPVFARVLAAASSIPHEVLQALFLFPQRKNPKESLLDGDMEQALSEFTGRAASCLSMIQMFISTVPLTLLGKVIFYDYDWQIGAYGGGEDWFVKYREEWKVIFDSRWKSWLRDRKKHQLAGVLKVHFGLSQFPELPYMPWKDLWGGVPFRCEMTGGFLIWFAENQYDTVMASMNPLVLEGVFLDNENRTQLSEALNDFSDINQHAVTFAYSLSEQGAIGAVFEKLKAEGVRSLKGQALADSTILNAEMSLRAWGKAFGENCRIIENVFSGIFDENKAKGFNGLQNFNTIKGRQNREFKEELLVVRDVLSKAKSILSEIEPLDLPSLD